MMDHTYITLVSVSGTYSAKDNHDGSAFPSPGKVMGTFISLAYQSGDEDLIGAARGLAGASVDEIVFTRYPDPVRENGVNYFTGNGDETRVKRQKTGEDVHYSIGKFTKKIAKNDTLRNVGEGSIFAYRVSGDSLDIDSLDKIAQRLTWFGMGGDFYTCYLSNERPSSAIPAHDRLLIPAKWASSTIELRDMSEELLAFYDKRYEYMYELHAGVPQFPPLPSTRWVEVMIPKDVEDDGYTVLGTSEPMKQYQFHKLASIFDKDSLRAMHPLTDRHGFIRGIALLPGDNGIIIADDTRLGLLSDSEPIMKSQQVSSWSWETTRWVSATPYSGSQSLDIVQWLMAKEGFSVERVSRDVLGSDQGVITDAPVCKIPANQRWYLEISSEVPRSGMIQLGDEQDRGFGMFRPVKEEEHE